MTIYHQQTADQLARVANPSAVSTGPGLSYEDDELVRLVLYFTVCSNTYGHSSWCGLMLNSLNLIGRVHMFTRLYWLNTYATQLG